MCDRADIKQIIADNSLLDPCNPDLTSKDIFNTYANSYCSENLCTKSLQILLYEMAEENDWIWETPEFKKCTNVYCVWKDIKKLSGNYFCNLIKNIEVDSTKGVAIFSDYIVVDGVTDLVNKNVVHLTFDESFCNKNDFLDIAALIIHELVHVDFRLKINDPKEYIENWKLYINKKYGIAYNSEHQVMIKEYMKIMANTLKKLDENRYPVEYYMAYVWDGLSVWWPDAFPQTTIDDWNSKRLIVKNDTRTYKCK